MLGVQIYILFSGHDIGSLHLAGQDRRELGVHGKGDGRAGLRPELSLELSTDLVEEGKRHRTSKFVI